MEAQVPPVVSARQKEIADQYTMEIDRHVADLKAGLADRVYEIRDLARLLHLHPVHLSNTVKEVTGKSTCDIFEERLLEISKELLLTTNLAIGAIARQLTYDPSNFTKFFKQFTGTTPKQFRAAYRQV
jgi:AraC-like DNA-binding protein